MSMPASNRHATNTPCDATKTTCTSGSQRATSQPSFFEPKGTCSKLPLRSQMLITACKASPQDSWFPAAHHLDLYCPPVQCPQFYFRVCHADWNELACPVRPSEI
eukprot:3604592-Amphidinium_carterae.1